MGQGRYEAMKGTEHILFVDNEEHEGARSAGARECLTKPLLKSELSAALRRVRQTAEMTDFDPVLNKPIGPLTKQFGGSTTLTTLSAASPSKE